ncbi:hypothetical protein SAMN05660443_0616 [Marinospirillum celere]|uniref:Uncharacterized protein n=1 Tax=Marinospirillum celere TaxID=1122252 RepID=A0A1I1EHG2_9GAMM|nr:hypothetical protein [Marinospirillum celere]SFB86624.1 hypothetical protein SAMN05660443_0616 [Marinospirillum celere]
MPRAAVIDLPVKERRGTPAQFHDLDKQTFISVPLASRREHPSLICRISESVWQKVLPGVEKEQETFGKTRKFLNHLVALGSDVAESLEPGREAPMLAGLLDGEEYILRCLRTKDAFYLLE